MRRPPDFTAAAVAGCAVAPPAGPGVRDMAGFLHGLASDRRKPRGGLAAAHAQLREVRRQARARRLRAGALKEGACRPQSKLEAPTNLDKALADRKHADDTDRRIN